MYTNIGDNKCVTVDVETLKCKFLFNANTYIIFICFTAV